MKLFSMGGRTATLSPVTSLVIDVRPARIADAPGLADVYAAAWREAYAGIIPALTRVKSYLDYGAFTPVQVAATAALNGPEDCIKEMRQIYRRRRDVLVDSFGRAGWPIPAPAASMFAWSPIPAPFNKEAWLKDTSSQGDWTLDGKLFGGQVKLENVAITRQAAPVITGNVGLSHFDLAPLSRLIAKQDSADGSTLGGEITGDVPQSLLMINSRLL